MAADNREHFQDAFKTVLERHGEVTAYVLSWLISLGSRQANERRRYFVTTSLIGWAQA